jgi:hypothetical protein
MLTAALKLRFSLPGKPVDGDLAPLTVPQILCDGDGTRVGSLCGLVFAIARDIYRRNAILEEGPCTVSAQGCPQQSHIGKQLAYRRTRNSLRL